MVVQQQDGEAQQHTRVQISRYLPPALAHQLVMAAAQHNIDLIDAITDQAAVTYPELVRAREDIAAKYASRAAVEA